jgi:hypothetical protein
MQQAPLRNSSIVGMNVLSHSGEYAPVLQDWFIPCRGLSLAFVRSYRSALSQWMS